MKRLLFFCAFLILFALACPLSGGGKNTGPEPPDLGGYFLPNPAVGLDGLRSYTQTLSISFRGTHSGEPLEFQQLHRQDFNRDTQTQFTTSTVPDVNGVSKTTIAGNMGQAYYVKLEGEDCRVSWGERAKGLQPLVPVQLLPPLPAVHEGARQDINGIAAKGYTFDAASLGYSAPTKIEGQIWLAEDGGYVVKFSMRIQDNGNYFGPGVSGEQTLEYDLSQINALAEPELPKGCQPVLLDFPAMPDASDLQRLPGTLTYTSPSPAAQIQSFYEQQLPPLGWTLSDAYSTSDSSANVIFVQEAESMIAYITLQKAESLTWVTVRVEPQAAMPGMFP